MATFQLAQRRTRRQKTLREQLQEEDLYEAIRIAVRTLFRFTHRASDARALWSDAHVVWLGKSTYLNWCMEDSEFDIPWVVSKSQGVPRDKERFKQIVAEEVMEFFNKELSVMPRKKTANWLPLP